MGAFGQQRMLLTTVAVAWTHTLTARMHACDRIRHVASSPGARVSKTAGLSLATAKRIVLAGCSRYPRVSFVCSAAKILTAHSLLVRCFESGSNLAGVGPSSRSRMAGRRRAADPRKVKRAESMGDVPTRRTAARKTLDVNCGPCNVVLLPFWNAFPR